jgi:hypothetical protein
VGRRRTVTLRLRTPRRRACGTHGRLRRRYGCFRLPRVPGAVVKESKRKDVEWLARTDPVGKTIEFSEHWDRLEPEQKRYIVLHERAHLKTGPDHDERFYEVLKELIKKHHVKWEVAYGMEQYNCHKSH